MSNAANPDDPLAALVARQGSTGRRAAAAERAAAEDEANALLLAAQRRKRARKGKSPTDDGLPAQDEIDISDEEINDDGIPDQATKAVERKRPRRRPLKGAARAGVFNAFSDEAEEPEGKALPGGITRGIHAGLGGIDWAQSNVRRFGPWGFAAALVAMVLLVFSFYAGSQVPDPMPVSNFRVSFLPGPQLPSSEVYGWLRRFPHCAKLTEPEPWVLEKLAAWLREQPAVREVQQLTVVHEPVPGQAGRTRRTLDLVLGLRQPVMPLMLASGARAWLDVEGHVLPGMLPGPAVRRPIVRAMEPAGLPAVRAALALWAKLEPLIEPGLVTDIHLWDVLDAKGTSRGIVLYTRQGSRLIWGNPAEERFGVRADDKVRDLVHTIRCQGDLARVASINVRFKQPFFELRDAR